ncbi:MAG: twin-arginine translocation signal domain-containing protein [Verrucomicrobia bacterium]|nr:twin-arginine translocation signal domain-containing protein [Verrucomicrobiota bacterium]
MKKTTLTRRDFLKTTSATGLAFAVVPRYVLSGSGQTPPSERLRHGGGRHPRGRGGQQHRRTLRRGRGARGQDV